MFNFFGQGEITLQDVEKSIKELPLPEKIKAVAIYKRYKEIRKIEEEMKESIKQLEKKYLKLDVPILDNISKLVSGAKAIEEAELTNLDKYLNEEEIKQAKEHLEPRKIPGYWQKVLSNAGLVKDHIGADDEPLLKAIENIGVVDEEGTDNFTIVFDFAENEIMSNKQLTKKFHIKKDSPTKADGTKIEWKGKNLCVKEVKKKQKNKKTGQQRVVTKTVDAKSFFNFFRTIEETEEINPLEATEEQLQHREKLEEDFEIGGVIVDEVLPYSLEYYLGIEHEGDEDFGDEEDDEEGEDEEEE